MRWIVVLLDRADCVDRSDRVDFDVSELDELGVLDRSEPTVSESDSSVDRVEYAVIGTLDCKFAGFVISVLVIYCLAPKKSFFPGVHKIRIAIIVAPAIKKAAPIGVAAVAIKSLATATIRITRPIAMSS